MMASVGLDKMVWIWDGYSFGEHTGLPSLHVPLMSGRNRRSSAQARPTWRLCQGSYLGSSRQLSSYTSESA